jgi:Ion channel
MLARDVAKACFGFCVAWRIPARHVAAPFTRSLATVGVPCSYGDVTPASDAAKAFFMVYVVATLVVQLTVLTTFVEYAASAAQKKAAPGSDTPVRTPRHPLRTPLLLSHRAPQLSMNTGNPS